MTTPQPEHRWYHLTPARFFIGLLVVQVVLFLSEWLHWFTFNERKGWTVLIAVGVVLAAVLVMLAWGLVCLCLRRRFQFGVRSLLLFVVVVSVLLGWFAWRLERASRQREAVKAILETGGVVRYDYEFDEDGYRIVGAKPPRADFLRKLLGDDFLCEVVVVESCWKTGYDDARHLQPVIIIEDLPFDCLEISDSSLAHLEGLTKLEELCLDGTQMSDSGLTRLNGLTKLKRLSLAGTQISNSGLAHLNGLTKLEELSLGNTQISDNGLAYLANMPQLKRLFLDKTQISDSGLAHLEALTKLDYLSLDGTQISDSGLAHLEGLTKLEFLSLDGTQIGDSGTDDGLEHLTALKSLTYLALAQTRVTDEGVQKLQQSLPNCKVWRQPRWWQPRWYEP